MKFIILVAWRNIWRNARRSLITATAMAVSVAMCMALVVFNDGFYEGFYDVLVKQKLSHVQVSNPNFAKTRSMYDTLDAAETLIEKIEQTSGTSAVTGRLHGTSLISKGEQSSGVSLMGIYPSREAALTSAKDQLIEGSYLTDEASQQIILGETLKNDIEAKLGEEVVLFSQAADGSMASGIYTVAGVYRSGSMMQDRGAQIHISDLQEFLVLDNQIHEILALGAEDELEDVERFAANITASIEGVPGLAIVDRDADISGIENPLQVETWWQASPQTLELMKFRDVGVFIFLGIVFFIAGFVVLNTMLMSVFERTRELGVLKALGLRPGKMIQLIVVESIFLSGLAAVIGLVVGGILSWLLITKGMDLSGGTGEPLQFMGANFGPRIYGSLDLYLTSLPTAALFLISVLASLWPAYRASRLEPVEAIRHD